MNARLEANADLKLLIQREPAHRVFFRNLSDTLFSRSVPPAPSTTKPGPFWKDVFVDSGLPWGAFMESMLWHIAIVSVLWTVGQTWAKQEQILQRRAAHQALTYYPPKKFPALSGRPPRAQERPKPQRQPAESALRVARDHRRNKSPVNPPDIKFSHANLPQLAAQPSSAPPLFAPRLRQPPVPQARATALAPAANIGSATTRRLDMPQPEAVAPAANAGSFSARRTLAPPGAAAIAPPPVLQAGLRKAPGAIAAPQVVAPAPQVSSREPGGILQRTSSGLLRPAIVVPPSSTAGSGPLGNRRLNSRVEAAAIPPPPSVIGSGNSAGGKLPPPLSGIGIVSPSPTMGGAAMGRSGRPGSLSGGVQAVPPSPSAGAVTIGGLRISSLAGTNTHVVPPPTSLTGQNSASSSRGTSPSGIDQRALAPPSSSSGAANPGGTQRASLDNGAQQVLEPAPALDEQSSISKSQAPMVATAVPPAPGSGSPSIPASIELPIRVIGMALSLPNSSYFANYEVFIAERKLKKGDPELIKLVYESLPYQPRLAEYGLDNSKVYKLRVTRDPACDETLLAMTWPQTDESHSGSKYATGPPALAPNEKNSLLPCYRTTADDYRAAVTRGR